MATTEIHAITVTPGAALNYIMSDKLVEYSEGAVIWADCDHQIVNLGGKKYVAYTTYTSFFHCSKLTPILTYKMLQSNGQDKYRKGGVGAKNGEPLMYHMHQSFKGREVDPITANEIGQKLCDEVFKGFAVTVSTHTNGQNIHNHFIVSAWNYDGRKWNDCHATKRKIREVSDRLCEEYGLSVLDKTRDMRLVKYQDSEGKTRYYEPTDRKNKLIVKRDAGRLCTDDIGSYRNTRQFTEGKKQQQRNRDIVKRDIDTLLPHCQSYDELLMRLRDLGYIVRAKRKNGEWLAHISFQPPTAEKATREDKLGDGKYYLRENLTALITEQAEMKELQLEPEADTHLDISYFDQYEYGTTDISRIDDNWRKIRDGSGKETIIPRTDSEKKVVADIRMADRELQGLIDVHTLRIMAESQNRRRKENSPYLTYTREQRLVARINDSLRCLQYTERHGIHGQQKILDLFRSNKRIYDEISSQLGSIQSQMERLKKVLTVPQKAKQIQERMDRECGNLEYRLDGWHEDTLALRKYQNIMRKYKIDTPEGLSSLAAIVNEYDGKISKLVDAMKNADVHMRELENCMRTYDRIDRSMGIDDHSVMQEFEKLLGNSGNHMKLSLQPISHSDREPAPSKPKKSKDIDR